MNPPAFSVTSKNPHNFSNSQIMMLQQFFQEFQFQTEERTSRIKKRIGSEVKTQTIHNWFKEQRDSNIQELERPGAEKNLPSEMALLHMTYDREPNIEQIKFLPWAAVHEVSESDVSFIQVRRYYKERTAREAIVPTTQKLVKQETSEPIKEETNQKFAIPKNPKIKEPSEKQTELRKPACGTLVPCQNEFCITEIKFLKSSGRYQFVLLALIHAGSEFNSFWDCNKCGFQCGSFQKDRNHYKEYHKETTRTGYEISRLLKMYPDFKNHFASCFGGNN
ncbi:hypothetical protein B9Z55_027334 [Caenorhabditis nigoni]|uniref:Homeobox domain-containing protein n=1 Tax=Caenorhabditis nigoni TaxID=1611254 RepID=A0A2G5SGL1_9PELO|nr:hypothetical protein B9Z55_027334 [Caenorhabditis nigoni]